VTTAVEADLYVQATSQFVPTDWVEITASDDPLPRQLRAIRADSDCDITVRTAGSGDTERVMKFLAGETRYGIFLAVTDISAGAAEGGV